MSYLEQNDFTACLRFLSCSSTSSMGGRGGGVVEIVAGVDFLASFLKVLVFLLGFGNLGSWNLGFLLLANLESAAESSPSRESDCLRDLVTRRITPWR